MGHRSSAECSVRKASLPALPPPRPGAGRSVGPRDQRRPSDGVGRRVQVGVVHPGRRVGRPTGALMEGTAEALLSRLLGEVISVVLAPWSGSAASLTADPRAAANLLVHLAALGCSLGPLSGQLTSRWVVIRAIPLPWTARVACVSIVSAAWVTRDACAALSCPGRLAAGPDGRFCRMVHAFRQSRGRS
jgi:hypothetical protein